MVCISIHPNMSTDCIPCGTVSICTVHSGACRGACRGSTKLDKHTHKRCGHTCADVCFPKILVSSPVIESNALTTPMHPELPLQCKMHIITQVQRVPQASDGQTPEPFVINHG